MVCQIRYSYLSQVPSVKSALVKTTEVKGKGPVLAIYNASYMSQTRDQKRFTIPEVAADWHELMIPQRTMRPSIAAGRLRTVLPVVQPADIPVRPVRAECGLNPGECTAHRDLEKSSCSLSPRWL